MTHVEQNRVEREFAARLDRLATIGDFVTEAAQQMNMGERDIYAVQMAVDEAATNIIEHAYTEIEDGTLHVACWKQGDDLVVEIRDRGQPFDPSDVPDPDLHTPLEKRREGGLGIFLMRRMMDGVEFSREGDENVLRMVRHSTPSAGLAAGTTLVSPKGRIDATTSTQLERLLYGPIEAGQRFVLVDLSQVSYISSSGLRVLLIAAKDLRRREGNLVLCCLQANVHRILQIAGFSEIFPLYQTREAALEVLCESALPE